MFPLPPFLLEGEVPVASKKLSGKELKLLTVNLPDPPLPLQSTLKKLTNISHMIKWGKVINTNVITVLPFSLNFNVSSK